MSYNGSCLCGKVSFKAEEIVGDYVLCHCPSCRKASGSAFGANISVPIKAFKLMTGEDFISTYESSPNKVRHFCSCCGSPLFTKVGASPEYVRVRLGSLDTPYVKSPSAQIFTAQKAEWHSPDPKIPCFDTWPTHDQIDIKGSRQPDEKS